jgi:hypothetical protein
MDWIDFVVDNKNFYFSGKKVYVAFMGQIDSIAPSQYLHYLWYHINNYGEGINSNLGGVKTLKTIPTHLKKDDSGNLYSTDSHFHLIKPLDWTLEDWKMELEYWKTFRIH